MSLYTTGELAKKCNVSVRTIQYYDERGILVPTDLTEGGRRLFSEKDVATLETICFLRDLDISIKDIAEILESDVSRHLPTNSARCPESAKKLLCAWHIQCWSFPKRMPASLPEQ